MICRHGQRAQNIFRCVVITEYMRELMKFKNTISNEDTAIRHNNSSHIQMKAYHDLDIPKKCMNPEKVEKFRNYYNQPGTLFHCIEKQIVLDALVAV